ncbi:MAG TPA: alpha/beta hydrolase, partial [Atribacterota bacterium]|nr:alpha/beta hydrolase [Atribacterota bacterium]
GNRDFMVKELPGLNHLFQTAQTGSPEEYALIEETIAPIALKLMSDWILAHVQLN